MRLQLVVQYVIQAVAHVDDVRLVVQRVRVALDQEPPLLLRVGNLRHSGLTRQHVTFYDLLRLDFRHLTVDAVLIFIVPPCRKKDRLLFCQIFREQSWKEL